MCPLGPAWSSLWALTGHLPSPSRKIQVAAEKIRATKQWPKALEWAHGSCVVMLLHFRKNCKALSPILTPHTAMPMQHPLVSHYIAGTNPCEPMKADWAREWDLDSAAAAVKPTPFSVLIQPSPHPCCYQCQLTPPVSTQLCLPLTPYPYLWGAGAHLESAGLHIWHVSSGG